MLAAVQRACDRRAARQPAVEVGEPFVSACIVTDRYGACAAQPFASTEQAVFEFSVATPAYASRRGVLGGECRDAVEGKTASRKRDGRKTDPR